jgi:hypothetical protein
MTTTQTATSVGAIRTRSTAPLALVKGGRIIGYAKSRQPVVLKRAARLGAEVLPIRDGRVATS